MKTSQNTVVMAYFLAAHSSCQALETLLPGIAEAVRNLCELIEVGITERLKGLSEKSPQLNFRTVASPEEITTSLADTSARQFFIVPTGHISRSKTMAPFRGKAKYGASSNCTGIGVQVNVNVFGRATPERRQSFVRQIVDWIISWYKQEYESQSVNSVPEGHVLVPATPWSGAYTLPERAKSQYRRNGRLHCTRWQVSCA